MALGVSEEYADILVLSEALNASGEEEKAFLLPPPQKRTGKRTLREFVEQNKSVWIV